MPRYLLVLTVLALFAGTLWAQGGTGELAGVMTDPTGAVVANAPITLTNTATGEQRHTVTTAAGTYRFPALPVVGTYTLQASPKGFKTAKVANIVISVGVGTNQDIHLELGSTSEQVTVEAGAQTVQTTESSLSDLVDRRVWQQMPLETRSQNDFINLLAGSVQGNIALNLVNGGTDRGAAVNGSRSGTGNYLVEGFDNNDQGLGGAGSLGGGTGGANTTISPDAIQEYRVIEHNFSAEYGKAGGFVTDTVLKSGTNQWHGSLFEYNRIQALAANSFFSNRAGVKDSLVRNQFGGSVGGPIVKDKTFFYFTTEFHRLRTSAPLSGNVVTDQFLDFVNSGQFASFAENDPNGVCNNQASIDFAAAFAGVTPPTAAPCPGKFSTGASIPNTTLGSLYTNDLARQGVPICVVGSQSCKNTTVMGGGIFTAFTQYPVPVLGQVTVGQSAPLDQARYTAKIDHKLSNSDQLSGAYLYDNADTTVQWAGGASVFGPPLPNHGRAMNAGITWSHTFSPTLLNQARVSYVRHTANFPGDPTAFAAGTPTVVTAFDSYGGAFGNANNLPQFFTENEFIFKDDLSLTKGKHNLKAGGSYARTRNGSRFESDFFGFFLPYGIEDILTDMSFGGNADQALFGGPALGSWFYAEAAINPTVTPATRPNYYRGFRANEMSAYFQDDWRLTNRLTLNLGLRWDYFSPPHNFQPNTDSNFFLGAPVTPIVTTSNNPFFPVNNPALAAFATGTLQIRNSEIWNKDTNNFAPRIGFAWDTMGNQKAVVRGGFGIAYDRMYNNIFENLRFNPPFFCFCNFGALVNGVAGSAQATPGIYNIPFASQGLFNDPTLFPNGLPKTSPRAIDQNLVTAYYEQANFGVQYEVAKNLVWETNYVGTFGRKLVGVVNLNTFPGRLAGGFDANRLNPLVNSINLRTNSFTSNYHALQTSLRKNFSNGLQFEANYTYAKALDEISDTFTPRGNPAAFNPSDSLNTQLDYGPADFDVRHRFVLSYNYELPFFKNNRWLGGWSTSGIVSLQSGVPFSVINFAVDSNANGTFNDRLAYIGPGQITHALTGGSPAGHNDGTGGFFDPTLFASLNGDIACPASQNDGLFCEGPAAGQSSRNSLVGPNYQNVDFGVAKRFKINERAAVQFQANFFNLFNRANFVVPDNNQNSGTFGKSIATLAPGQGGARVTQLALRFDF
jgi:hypothetical protein